MKYIDADRLRAELERLHKAHSGKYGCDEVGLNLEHLEDFIDSLQQEPRFPQYDNIVDKVFGAGNLEGFEYREAEMLVALAKEELLKSLQQEQPVTKEPISHLEHWLAFFGCPEENIEKCATQIAQGYGAIRYLEGVQHGAEAVNELAKQERPDFDDVDPKHLVHSHYTKVRETKTGRVFWAEYSSEAAEWYEAGTGKAYSISDVEIVKEQPAVDLEKAALHVYESWMGGTMDDVRRDMVELGKVLNARKEE